MLILKLFGKIIVLPMILITTVIFFVVDVLSKIYGLAAAVFNLIMMLCAIIALCMQQWKNFGIAVAVLVISYLLMGAWESIKYGIALVRGHLVNALIA